MELTTKKARYYFAWYAMKHRRIPTEMIQHIYRFLVGEQEYIHHHFSKMRLLSNVQEKTSVSGKKAVLLEADLTDKECDECYFNGMIGIVSVHPGDRFYMDIIRAKQGLLIDELPYNVVQTVRNVMQPSSMLTPASFLYHFNDARLLPYATFISGVTDTFFFYKKLREPAITKSALHHFLLLGNLSGKTRPSLDSAWNLWFDNCGVIADVLRYLVSNKNFLLLQRMEANLNWGLDSKQFEDLIWSLLLLDGYKYCLTRDTMRYESVLFNVLVRLLREIKNHQVPFERLSKFECMINLNIKKPEFRQKFAAMVSEAGLPVKKQRC